MLLVMVMMTMMRTMMMIMVAMPSIWAPHWLVHGHGDGAHSDGGDGDIRGHGDDGDGDVHVAIFDGDVFRLLWLGLVCGWSSKISGVGRPKFWDGSSKIFRLVPRACIQKKIATPTTPIPKYSTTSTPPDGQNRSRNQIQKLQSKSLRKNFGGNFGAGFVSLSVSALLSPLSFPRVRHFTTHPSASEASTTGSQPIAPGKLRGLLLRRLAPLQATCTCPPRYLRTHMKGPWRLYTTSRTKMSGDSPMPYTASGSPPPYISEWRRWLTGGACRLHRTSETRHNEPSRDKSRRRLRGGGVSRCLPAECTQMVRACRPCLAPPQPCDPKAEPSLHNRPRRHPRRHCHRCCHLARRPDHHDHWVAFRPSLHHERTPTLRDPTSTAPKQALASVAFQGLQHHLEQPGQATATARLPRQLSHHLQNISYYPAERHPTRSRCCWHLRGQHHR